MDRETKVLAGIRLILSIAVLVLALLQLFGVWADAGNAYVPLVGLLMVVQAAAYWGKSRTVALVSLAAAIFILAVTLAVVFL